MSLPRYQVVLIDCNTGLTKAVFDGTAFWDLRYSRVLNGIGRIAMTIPGNNRYRSLFGLDFFLEVYRTDPTSPIQALIKEETYLTRLTHRFREENDERFVVGGVSLNHLLKRRIVDPTTGAGGSGGFSTKAGPADTVIYDYCREQIGPLADPMRQIPNFTITPVVGTGQAVGARLRFENLLEQIQDLAHRGNTDFIITRTTSNNLVLTIAPIGADKTQSTNYPWNSWVGLNPPRGNLQRPSFQIDRTDEANFVYALGEGQGANRTLLTMGGNTVTDSPFNRIEFTDDVRNINKNDPTGMLTGARVALYDNLPKFDFSFEPTGLEPGNIYRLDWDVGDRVTAYWDEYSQNLRMTEIEISVSGESGESIKVTSTRYDP